MPNLQLEKRATPMILEHYVPNRRFELVAEALGRVLDGISEPQPTPEIVDRVCADLRVGTHEKIVVAKILMKIAPNIPEAQRGESFRRWGRDMSHWMWWPKGTSPSGPTRQAVRDHSGAHITNDQLRHALTCPECMNGILGVVELERLAALT